MVLNFTTTGLNGPIEVLLGQGKLNPNERAKGKRLSSWFEKEVEFQPFTAYFLVCISAVLDKISR